MRGAVRVLAALGALGAVAVAHAAFELREALRRRVAALSEQLRHLETDLAALDEAEARRAVEGDVAGNGTALGRGSEGVGYVVPLFKGLDYDDGPSRLYYLANVLSPSEVTHIVERMTPWLQPSEVMSYSNQEVADKNDLYTRSSETAMFESEDEVKDVVVSRVLDRLHTVARMPRHRGENFQMTRYREGERYVFHYDSSLDVGRLLTTLVFLSDLAPDEGGATVFPHGRLTERGRRKLFLLTSGRAREVAELDGTASDAWHASSKNDYAFRTSSRDNVATFPSLLRDVQLPPRPNATAPLPRIPDAVSQTFKTPMEPFCDHPDVLKFPPRRGDGILWFNHEPDLSIDKKALHGGCPPKHGKEKIICQRWMRFFDAVEGNRYAKLVRKCLGTP
jgi:hypothetical protein